MIHENIEIRKFLLVPFFLIVQDTSKMQKYFFVSNASFQKMGDKTEKDVIIKSVTV